MTSQIGNLNPLNIAYAVSATQYARVQFSNSPGYRTITVTYQWLAHLPQLGDIASSEVFSEGYQSFRDEPGRIAQSVTCLATMTRVGVIKIVIVINCNLITFSKVIACNCN